MTSAPSTIQPFGEFRSRAAAAGKRPCHTRRATGLAVLALGTGTLERNELPDTGLRMQGADLPDPGRAAKYSAIGNEDELVTFLRSLALWLSLALPAPAQSLFPQGAAGTPTSGEGATQLVEILRDDAARDELIRQLQATAKPPAPT